MNDEELWMFDEKTGDYTINWYEHVTNNQAQNIIMNIMNFDPDCEEEEVEPTVSNFQYLPLEQKYQVNLFFQSGLGYFLKETYFLVELNRKGEIINYVRLPHPNKWVRKRLAWFDLLNGSS